MTSHASPQTSDDSHVNQSVWEWWLVAFMALVAAAFGAYGLWIYEVARGAPADFWSVGYHTLQLFALHAPHLDNPVPWQLNVGRWLSAIVVLGTVARGLYTVFRSECRLLASRFLRRGHVIICGLGKVGMQLALEFRREGYKVVAIEANGTPGQIASAHNAKVAVITGDACNPDTLRRAAVDRASRIIAVCDDDQKNVAIAVAAGKILDDSDGHKPDDAPRIECWLFISDPRLRQVFQRDGLFPYAGPHYRVNVRGLDLFELSARQILRRAPIDYERISENDPRVVHLVLVGFGSMGQNLVLQAAKIGHFANFKKLQVTVIEQKGSTRADAFLAHYPKFTQICDFASKTVDVSEDRLDPDAVMRVLPPRDTAKELLTVAVCWESPGTAGDEGEFLRKLESDDPTNLNLALALSNGTVSRVLLFQTRKAGFGALFPVDGRGEAIGSLVHPFGMLEEALSMDALVNESEDAIAKVLHNDYYDKQIAGGRKPGDRPALYPWEQLREHFRDSNRRAADHIRVKLRAIGYRVDHVRDDLTPIGAIPENQIEVLARMEHESWCAELMLQGYSYGPGERDDVAKTHQYLLPWDKLEKKQQRWDADQVRAIPAALAAAKYRIYPQTL